MSLQGLGTILHLTWRDMRRRKIVQFALASILLYLLVFAAALYFLRAEILGPVIVRMQLVGLTVIGLYVAHFMAAMMAIVLPLDTLSGEIDSGVIQTLVSKPIERATVLFGKWLAHWFLATALAIVTMGGVLLASWIETGLTPANLVPALPLIALEMGILVTIVVAGGTRFNTVTNAIFAFGLFSLAFVGGWIEQIGTLAGSPTARHIGIGLSLVIPHDAVSRLTASYLQPCSVSYVIAARMTHAPRLLLHASLRASGYRSGRSVLGSRFSSPYA